MMPREFLFKMINVCPTVNVVPTVTTRLLLVIVSCIYSPIAVLSWSYPLPAVVPLISTRKLESGNSVSAPVSRIRGVISAISQAQCFLLAFTVTATSRL